MAVLKNFIKYATERKRLYLDYSQRLETTENLTSFQTVVSPDTPESPLTLNLAFTDVTNKKMMVFYSGGIRGIQYVLQIIVQTDEGQKWRDDFGVKVE